ncbi:MAG: hypothetical protein HY360_02260 [Verrucomicrobia bacterium]|nr:hypothetical protein [Verrucomicrobiota bacterium]
MNRILPHFFRFPLVAGLLAGQVCLVAGNPNSADKDAAFQVEIHQPFYANCIFPGEDVRAIEGTVRVNVPLDTLRDPKVCLTLQGPGADSKPLRKKLQQGAANFELNASNLQVGEFQLKCELLSADKLFAEKTVTIRKLAQPAGSCVRIDKNLNLVVNGTPIFMRSWMSDERYLISQALSKTPHPDSRFVNLWHGEASTVLANGEYLCAQAEILDPSEAATRVKTDVKPSPKVLEGMKRLIAERKDKPELRYYYLCDEPECRTVSPIYLKHQYDLIKALDPYHPVVIVTRAPENYTQCADILSPHPYVNPVVDAKGRRTLRSGPMTMIRRQIQTVLTAGKGRVAPWLTPQAFTYSISDLEADYPTFTEFRCMIYSAIANGCRGFYPYLYFDHFNSLDLRLGCDFIYETLASLDPFLLSSAQPSPVKMDAPENGVDVWIKKVDGKVLLIAANVLDRELDANISSAGLQGISELHGYREKTTAKVAAGACALHFAPYQVHLLSNPRMGENMKTVEELQAEIAAAKAALKKPGNILYGRGREIQWDASDNYPILGGYFPIITLTDGLCDALGWRDVFRKAPARVEMAFPKFKPRFRSARIYSATVEDLEFWIWKEGQWVKAAEEKGNQEPVIKLTFPEEITTVKIKILMPKVHPGLTAELYEIELYE